MEQNIPLEELMFSGHTACSGCGGTIAMRHVLKGLGENTMVVIPACCWTILAGAYPTSALKIPIYHTAFETTAAVAAGVKAGLKAQGKEVLVLGWAGDGGTYDIGLQALSAAAERNDDIVYVCYDNEAYMNTGIQRSSATPLGAWTTTTPRSKPKSQPKKDIMAIMAAHRIPYAATASIAHPEDLIRKVKKAKEIQGTRFILVLSPCPTGWRFDSNLTVKLARLAVQTRVFNLYEVENGENYRITLEPEVKPVEEYLKLQGRFRHLKETQIKEIQANVDKEWARLQKLAQN